jgi:hypothetical protein
MTTLRLLRFLLCAMFVTTGASLAFAADTVPPPPAKASARVAKSKPKPKPVSSASNRDKKLFDPNTPLTGAAKSSQPVLPSSAVSSPATSDSDISFGLKWHATNDPIDRFDDVRHTAGPNGQGAGAEAGIKLGF